jgi:hypothetical protein
MSGDAELDLWRNQWQREDVIPAGLRRKVERHGRFLRIMVLGDLLVTAVIGGATAAWAIQSRQPDVVVLALGTWTFIAAAWAFSWMTRRGLFTPSALNTAAFVDLSIRRCRAALASVVFGIILYFVEMIFCLAWLNHRGRLSWEVLLLVGIGSVAFVVLILRHRRTKRAELAWLRSLQAG